MSALVFDVDTGGSLCVDSIAPHVELAVSLDGVEVGGAFTWLGGDTLVWRPQEPLPSGAEGIARIVVDNAALGPTNGESGFGEGPCGPELLEVELPFTVAGDASSPLPALPPPLVELRTRPMDRSFAGITCCPGIVPLYQDGDCVGGVYWEEEGGCAHLYEETRFYGSGPAQALPASVEKQVWYQLYADDVPVAGGRDARALYFQRKGGACATLEAIHLGTGEVVTSAAACLSPAEAASLGPHALALDDITCPESQICSDDWSPETCAPLDPENFPPPPPLTGDTKLSPDCGGPGGSSSWVEIDVEAEESEDDDGASGGADDNDEVGCGCRQGSPGSLVWLGFVVLALGLRRRGA